VGWPIEVSPRSDLGAISSAGFATIYRGRYPEVKGYPITRYRDRRMKGISDHALISCGFSKVRNSCLTQRQARLVTLSDKKL
jgi:hypothetical protein